MSCPIDGGALYTAEDISTHNNSATAKASAAPSSTIAGKYILMEELGTGGWGTVYLAKHRELESKVAIKILSPELSQNLKHLDRFKQESITLGRLEHSGVVKVIDFGLSPSPFIVMEYVQGKLLSEYLENRRALSEPEIYYIFRRLVETLAYAHNFAVIHRDLKPQNIMVNRVSAYEPAEIEVKLLDFGIAKLLDQAALAETTGETFGSPQYMSPEQFDPEQEISTKADIYSLGCIIFECLTRRKPFKARSYLEWRSVHQHVRADFNEEDPKLGKLGQQLGQLALQCLSKSPEERPCAADLLETLRNIQVEKYIRKAPKPTFISTNIKKLAWAAIAIVFLVAVGTQMCLSYIREQHSAQFNLGKKHFEQEDTKKVDFITSISGGNTLVRYETSDVTIDSNKKLGSIPLKIFKPENAKEAILVMVPKKEAPILETLYQGWAEKGFAVVVLPVVQSQADADDAASVVTEALDYIQKNNVLAAPALRFDLVALNQDLETTLALGRKIAAEKDEAQPDLAGIIVIDPHAAHAPKTEEQQYHAGKFSVFYIMDADLERTERNDVAKLCKTAFKFGAGRQVFYQSTRVSLSSTPAYSDQRVLGALMNGFLFATLKRDAAKEGYLYSQKSELAVTSVAQFRFR